MIAKVNSRVEIDLIVRGICCLRPGVPGLSERIRVISIVDRYLEHARIFFFQNGDAPEYLLASADWMPRNLDRRVEIAFPVLDPTLSTSRSETSLPCSWPIRSRGADSTPMAAPTASRRGPSPSGLRSACTR
jgi:polyphosphate kinase